LVLDPSKNCIGIISSSSLGAFGLAVRVPVDPLEPLLARRHSLVCLAQPSENVGLEGRASGGLVLTAPAVALRQCRLQPAYRVVVALAVSRKRIRTRHGQQTFSSLYLDFAREEEGPDQASDSLAH
jgi:hypothetical protein